MRKSQYLLRGSIYIPPQHQQLSEIEKMLSDIDRKKLHTAILRLPGIIDQVFVKKTKLFFKIVLEKAPI